MVKKYYRKKKTTKKPTLARQVAIVKKLVTARAPEVKYSWAQGLTTVDNNPTFGIFPYRTISVGTSDFQNRIGDDVMVRRIAFKGWFALPAIGAGIASSMVRALAFIYKRNPDAITTTFSTIINLYLESSGMNSYQAPNAFQDWDNAASFSTLMDRRIAVNSIDAASNTVVPFDFSLTIPQKYKHVEYSAGSTNPVRNELIIAFLADTDTAIQYAYTYRFTYTDP